MPNVDAKLQGGRRYQRPQATLFQCLLCLQAVFPRQAAVMSGHRLLTKTLGEVLGQALGQAPGVHEYQGGAMCGDQLFEPVIHLIPDLVRHDRSERRGGELQLQVPVAAVPHVHDRAFLATGKEISDPFQRFLCRGQTDARRPAAAQRIEARHRQRQVAAALAAGDGMDLVHDDRARVRQHVATGRRGQQQVQ